MEAIDPFVFRLSIFVLAIFVGYFVVWSVTPALHTPLMAVTNAISSVIVVGALIAVSVNAHAKPENVVIDYNADGNVYVEKQKVAVQSSPPAETMKAVDQALQSNLRSFQNSSWTSKLLGFFALILASVNIFGGFLVTQRMLAMYKKKAK